MHPKKVFFIFLFMLILINFVSADKSYISVNLLNQDPDPANQGSLVEVKFKIENIGAATVDNVEIELLPKYPFSIYSGNSSINLGKLRPSSTGEDAMIISYKLKVDQNALKGYNSIDLIVKKEGELWDSYTNDEFQIKVAKPALPDLRIYLKDKTLLKSQSKGTITLELANVDEGDSNFLQLTLLPSEDYLLLSPSNYVYIGDLKSDDTDSQDFEIYVPEINKTDVLIPVLLEYQNVNGDKYEKRFDLSLKLYSNQEINQYGLVKKSFTLWIVLGIVFLFILYKVYKHFKKRNKH